MRLVSLGYTCEVAFEIRMHTPKNDADYFDWLITPFDALIGALNSRFEHQLHADDLYLEGDKNFVVNRRTGIKFGHIFKRKDHDIIDDFLSDLDRVNSIFSYLSEKFERNANRGEPLGFVRRNLSSAEAQILADTISSLYPRLDFKIIAVNAENLNCAALDPMRFCDLVIPPSGNDGLGHPEPWAAELIAKGLTETPFIRTKDDVFGRLMRHQVGDVHTLIGEANELEASE